MITDTDTLFNVVIAYEDYEADTRARHMMDRLALQLGTEFRILTDDWKFEMIDDRRLRSHAVQAAAGADMIILAISGDGELPAHIKDWFEQWTLCPRAEPVALVVLHRLEQETLDESPSLRRYLHSICASRGIDLFWYGDHQSEADSLYASRSPTPDLVLA
jgi:hypothetical protein